MRIVLVPQVVVNGMYPAISQPFVPLGLLCLGGAVDRTTHDLEIIDLTMAVRDGVLPYDDDFEKAAARRILERRPDMVGFSTFSCTYHHTLKIAREIAALSPDTIIVFGGPQATFCPEETVESFPVDYVVRGEGEQTFPELLEALGAGRVPHDVPGLTFRHEGRTVRTPDRPLVPDLDALPLPAWDLYPLARHPKAPIELSRGCPYACTFCATSTFWQRKVRHKSIDRILLEMSTLADRYDVQYISFADDMFTVHRKWTLEFCERLVAREFPKKWLCSTRVDAVDDELLTALARAGCDKIFYGVESGSDRIQKSIRKHIKVDRILDTLHRTAAHGLKVTASLMLGFPDETEDDLRKTLEIRNEIQLIFPEKQSIQVHVLSPDVFTEISRVYKDRIRYDGYHSDQSGKLNSRFDEEMILRYPNLFLAYYYIEGEHLSREFIKYINSFLFATQVICYWSSLYVMLRDGDPLRLAKEWIAFFKANSGAGGVIRDGPLLSMALASTGLFFQWYFREESGLPLPIRELFRHEYEMMRVKGGLIVDPEMQRRLAEGVTLSTHDYQYDPRETIALIRQGIDRIDTQPRRPTRIDYAPRRRANRERDA